MTRIVASLRDRCLLLLHHCRRLASSALEPSAAPNATPAISPSGPLIDLQAESGVQLFHMSQ
jgi:hypothetical protein